MLDILSITTPIYILILLGYVLTRVGFFSKADMKVLGRLVVHVALPCLVFKSLSQSSVSEVMNVGYLLAYTLGSLAVIVLGYFVSSFKRGAVNPTFRTFWVMGMSCSNSGFVGYPVLLLTLANVAGVALAMNMVVENLLIIPLLLFLAQKSENSEHVGVKGLIGSLLSLFKKPFILSLMGGLILSIFEIKLATPLAHSVSLLANASSALSLMVIGGVLVDLPMRGLGPKVFSVVVGKLLVHPVMVGLAFLALSDLGLASTDPSLKMAAIVFAATPTMGIYVTLAQDHGQEDFAAIVSLVVTIASFFTMSALLWTMKFTNVFH